MGDCFDNIEVEKWKLACHIIIELHCLVSSVSAIDPARGIMQKDKGRPDEDAESVFSDSEEEEGAVLGGRRDVASDAEDEGDVDVVDDSGTGAGKKKPPPHY